MESKVFNKEQIEFIQLLIREGEVDVDNAAKRIGVTKATIYNYFNEMKNMVFERRKGTIRLYRPNLRSNFSNLNDPFLRRQYKNEKEKARIARYICEKHINNDDVIFLDCGSSTLQIAEQISEQNIRDLTIVTNNPFVMIRLHNYEEIREFLIIGGSFSREAGSFYGPWVSMLLKNIDFRFKKAFIGADGIGKRNGKGIVTLLNENEKMNKLQIIEMADEVYIPVDHSKIEKGGVILAQSDEPFWNKIKVILGCKQPEGNIKIDELSQIFGEHLKVV